MRVQNSGLYSLLFIVSTAAGHASSSVTSSSSIALTTPSINSTTSLPTIPSIASSDKFKSKTKSKTKVKSTTTAPISSSPPSSTPSPPPSTFYLVVNTPEPGFDNTYLRLFTPFQSPGDPNPPTLVLQAGLPTPAGAATFTLTPAGYLICNTATGPLYASFYGIYLSYSSAAVRFLAFDDPSVPDAEASVAVRCTIAAGVLNCVSPERSVVDTLFLSEGYVVNDAPDDGHILYLAREDYPTPMITVRVVPI